MLSGSSNDAVVTRERTSAVVILGFVVLLASAAVGVTVATDGPVVQSGTTFNASADGPTITVTENLELDDSAIFPDDGMVDLSPNATFTSESATNATVDSIDGDWTNLTTHNVSGGLDADPTDKQQVTVEGDDVANLSFRDVDTSSGEVDLSYSADAEFNLTVTNLPADQAIEAVDADTGAQITTETTDSQGTATFTFGSGDLRIDLREDTSGGGGKSDTGPRVRTQQTGSGIEVTIDRVSLNNPTVSVQTAGIESGGICVKEVSATFNMGTTVDNTMSIHTSSTPPSNTPDPPNADRVRTYVSIEIDGNLADSVVEGRFTLDVSGTNVAPEDMTAHRYTGNEWQEVEARAIGDTTVEVVSPNGYSVFAIGDAGSNDTEQPTTATPISTRTQTATATPTTTTATSTPTGAQTVTTTPTATTTDRELTPETESTTEPALEETTTGGSGPGFEATAVLFALFAMTMFAVKRRG